MDDGSYTDAQVSDVVGQIRRRQAWTPPMAIIRDNESVGGRFTRERAGVQDPVPPVSPGRMTGPLLFYE